MCSVVVACRLSCPVACGILTLQPGIKSMPPAVEAWSLNHWTTRDDQWYFSIDAKIVFNKIQHQFIIQSLSEIGSEGYVLNMVKGSPKANILFNQETLEDQEQGKNRPSTPLFYIVPEILANTTRQINQFKAWDWVKKKYIYISICRSHNVIPENKQTNPENQW